MTDEKRNLSIKPNPMGLLPIGEAEESCAKANIDQKEISKCGGLFFMITNEETDELAIV